MSTRVFLVDRLAYVLARTTKCVSQFLKINLTTIGVIQNPQALLFGIAEESPTKVGFKVENTTATWVNFDNFKLEKTSSTDINSIKADNSHHAIIYNLAGQRLSKPKKSINIIGGRKVVVK